MYLDVIITVCQIPNIQLVCKKRWKGSNLDKTHPGRINKIDCYFFAKHLGPKKALISLQLFVSLFFWTMCYLEFESISKHIYYFYNFRYTMNFLKIFVMYKKALNDSQIHLQNTIQLMGERFGARFYRFLCISENMFSITITKTITYQLK